MSLTSDVNGWCDGTISLALGSSQPVPPEWHIPAKSPSDLAPSAPPSPLLSDSSYPSPTSSPSIPPAPQPPKPRSKAETSSRKAAKMPGHIPRPRNAFLIFRTDLGARVKANGVEHDHRMISKILGKVWMALPAEEKAVYQKRAAEEKREHRLKYPNYRFSPRQRTEKAKKRNVKRNGVNDRQRCSKVALLLLEGKGGAALKAEVDKFDRSSRIQRAVSPAEDYSTGVFDSRVWSTASSATSETSSVPSSPCSSMGADCPDSSAPSSPISPHSPVSNSAITSPLNVPQVGSLDGLQQNSSFQVLPSDYQQYQPPAIPDLPLHLHGEAGEMQYAGEAGCLPFPNDFSSIYPRIDGLGLNFEGIYSQSMGDLGSSQPYTQGMIPMHAPLPQRAFMGAPYNPPMQAPIERCPEPGPRYDTHAPAQPELTQQLPFDYSTDGSSSSLVNGASHGSYSFVQSFAQQGVIGGLQQFPNPQQYQYAPDLAPAPTQAMQAQIGQPGQWGLCPNPSSTFGVPPQGQLQPATEWEY